MKPLIGLRLIKYAVFHPWRSALVLVIGGLLGTAAFYAYTLNAALGAVATEDFPVVLAIVMIVAIAFVVVNIVVDVVYSLIDPRVRR